MPTHEPSQWEGVTGTLLSHSHVLSAQNKGAERKRLFWWGVRGGECGGLVPAAPLTISLWLLGLAGKFQHCCGQHRSWGATIPVGICRFGAEQVV